jgi:hypothetical protein
VITATTGVTKKQKRMPVTSDATARPLVRGDAVVAG